MVTVELPLPTTVAPPAGPTVNVPSPTASTVNNVPVPASGSATARPGIGTSVSGSGVNVAGSALTGASLTGLIVRVVVCLTSAVPSNTSHAMVRVGLTPPLVGSSLLETNCTDWNSA